MLQQLGAHHRRQGERNHGRNQNGHRKRDRELAEETAHNIAHEQQRDEHRDQRYGQRNDGETNLPGALERGLQRGFAGFQIAVDILDHHDRIIDHETGRNRERHQREVVEAVSEQVHHAKSSDQRKRNGDAGDDGCRQIPQEQEHHHDHQHDGEHEFKLHIIDRGANGLGAVGEHGNLHRGGQRRTAVAAESP